MSAAGLPCPFCGRGGFDEDSLNFHANRCLQGLPDEGPTPMEVEPRVSSPPPRRPLPPPKISRKSASGASVVEQAGQMAPEPPQSSPKQLPQALASFQSSSLYSSSSSSSSSSFSSGSGSSGSYSYDPPSSSKSGKAAAKVEENHDMIHGDQDFAERFYAKKRQEELESERYIQELLAQEEAQQREAEELRRRSASGKVQCGLCGFSVDLQKVVVLDGCPHTYCSVCLPDFINKRVKAKTVTEKDLCCREPSCRRPFSNNDIKSNISPQEFEAYEKAVMENFIADNSDTMLKCPNPACGSAMERVAPSADALKAIQSTGAAEERGLDGKPLSVEAIMHREQHRFRCRDCSTEFCGACNATPYHLGYTCDQFSTYSSAKKCRFCEAALTPENRAPNPPPGLPLLQDVCSQDICKERRDRACGKQLPCGHICCGLRNESPCLPCLVEDCPAHRAAVFIPLPPRASAPAPAGKAAASASSSSSAVAGPSSSSPSSVSQTADDFCNICFVESLPAAPCIQLTSCGHIFHHKCCEDKLSKKWPGARITFGFMQCPLCKTPMEHPALDTVLQPLKELQEKVKTMSGQRMRHEGLLAAKEIVGKGEKFYQNPEGYAMHTFAYYPCYKCHRPYFGGMRRCEDAAEDPSKPFKEDELVCGACSAGPNAKECPRHGNSYMEFKCKFCCNIANWYCWGNTHFCDDCHKRQENGDYLTRKKREDLPKCPGPHSGGCKVKIPHPPNGEEFSLGCAICRHSSEY